MAKVESSTEVNNDAPINLSKKQELLLSVTVYVIFLFLLEGCLRLFGVGSAPSSLPIGSGLYREANNSIGFEYTPGWEGVHAGARVHINSAGWRGKDFSPTKLAGTYRILGVGDSFTFGKAVNDEDVFLVQLEGLLNGGEGGRFETLNSGHEGINTVAELQYFNEYGMLSLAPDVVVLGFVVSNDAETTPNRRAYRKLRRTATLPLRITESDWFSALAERSRIARVLAGGAEWISTKKLSQINAQVILSNYEDGSESWEACRNALLGFYDICRQHRIPFILALFPDCSSDMNEAFRDYPEEFKRVHAKITAVLSGKSGAVVVDILDDLAATSLTARQTMVPIDGHPNALWHQIVARRLQQTIKELNLGSAHALIH